jgi:hypothetical protein
VRNNEKASLAGLAFLIFFPAVKTTGALIMSRALTFRLLINFGQVAPSIKVS